MLFYPWYPAMMLAAESNSVIDVRLWRIATGGVDAVTETHLMISEKIGAALDAGAMLMLGKSPVQVIEFYRAHVAANALRLASRAIV